MSTLLSANRAVSKSMFRLRRFESHASGGDPRLPEPLKGDADHHDGNDRPRTRDRKNLGYSQFDVMSGAEVGVHGARRAALRRRIRDL